MRNYKNHYSSNYNLQMRKLTKTGMNLTPPPAHPFHHSHFKKPRLPSKPEFRQHTVVDTLGWKTVVTGFRLVTGRPGYTVNSTPCQTLLVIKSTYYFVTGKTPRATSVKNTLIKPVVQPNRGRNQPFQAKTSPEFRAAVDNRFF